MVVHIVEDDDAVADALAIALENMDHHPKTYSDGETFLSCASWSAGDWVIVDLGLPGISGSDLVRQLNEQPDPPRVVAITGKPYVSLVRLLRDLPGLTILRKPLSIEMLFAALA